MGIERRSLIRVGWLAVVIAGGALQFVYGAQAHGPEKTTNRIFVRLQGVRAVKPEGVKVERAIKIAALAEQSEFFATEVQRYGFTEGVPDPTAQSELSSGEKPLRLQGAREHIARFNSARPEQMVTILAEQRPGSPELFVLAIDLCPPK